MDNLNSYAIGWSYPYQISDLFFQQSAFVSNYNAAVNELNNSKVKLSQSQKQIENLKSQLSQIKGKKIPNDKKKKKISKKRKRNDNLKNEFECPYERCPKGYASNLALNLHMKLKHNGGTKKQREAIAKMIIDAKNTGGERPQTYIEFPPNYIENYEKYLSIKNELDK